MIVTNDQRWDDLERMEIPVIPTTHLDSSMTEAVFSSNYFVTTPVYSNIFTEL